MQSKSSIAAEIGTCQVHKVYIDHSAAAIHRVSHEGSESIWTLIRMRMRPDAISPSRRVLEKVASRFTAVRNHSTARRLFVVAVVLLFLAALIRGLRLW